MARKSDRTNIDDISIVFACPQCGKQVQEDLQGFEDKREYVCRLGGHTFWLTDEQQNEIIRKPGSATGSSSLGICGSSSPLCRRGRADLSVDEEGNSGRPTLTHH